MKIVLINPPHPHFIDPTAQAPLGLLYLAAILEVKHEVSILNLAAVENVHKVSFPNADVYGLTTTSVDYKTCKEVANLIMMEHGNRKIIIGGPGITAMPELDDWCFDSYVIGEAESIIGLVINDIENGKLKRRYYGGRTESLDSLPLPAWHLMDVMGGRAFLENYEGKSCNIMAGRGCPFNCAFCTTPYLWGRKVTVRSPENVVAEVRFLKRAHGVNLFRFNDDTINLSRKWFKQFCSLMEKEDVIWRSCFKIDLCTEDDLKMMKDSGCTEPGPGIESFDQRVLDRLNKKTTVEKNVRFLEMAARVGLKVKLLMMIGTPGETMETPEINKSYLDVVPHEYISLTFFRPMPGSDIWYHPEKYGARILDRNFEDYDFCLQRKTNGIVTNVPARSFIETELSKEALEDNMTRMREYTKDKCEAR